MRSRILCLPLLAGLLLCCRSAEPRREKPPENTIRRTRESVTAAVAAADRSTGSWLKREGRWSRGGSLSTFTAYLDRGAIQLIAEELDDGPRGTAAVRYYFDPKGLYHYIERRKAPGIGDAQERSEVRLTFDEFNGLIDSMRMVNGQAGRLSGDELPKALAHADELRAAIEGR
jgi:hypothetical protein